MDASLENLMYQKYYNFKEQGKGEWINKTVFWLNIEYDMERKKAKNLNGCIITSLHHVHEKKEDKGKFVCSTVRFRVA